ncbi:MAG: 4Fe-4S dicluster domain-containing protein [Chloroflexi bacterium]|nr:4Fe-4S dicluster domain-containing protein [Chloroflexota bacterium]MCL5107732.1 4Fe-4S dicluster domain-containing protein [Chloroflexota bacterium]
MPNMLSNILGNIFARPATRAYPAVRRPPFSGARGHIVFDTKSCGFCGACSRRCPSAAIVINRTDKTLTFDPFRCIICEACVEVCPRKSIAVDSQYRAPAYVKTVEVHTLPAPPEEAPRAAG